MCSAGVAQARRNAVDGDVDAALDALIRCGLVPKPFAVAANQFNLQMVQRIQIGKPVLDGALQRRIASQALLVPGDQHECCCHAVPLGLNQAENLAAQSRVAHQVGIARGQRQVALGQHHVHVAEQRAKKRPLTVHFLQQRQRLLAAAPK